MSKDKLTDPRNKLIDPRILQRMVKAVEKASSTDSWRPQLAGVNISSGLGSTIDVTATDGHRLVTVNGDAGFVLPSEVGKQGVTILPGEYGLKRLTQASSLEVSERLPVFRVPPDDEPLAESVDDYPDWRKVMPAPEGTGQSGKAQTSTLDRDGFASCLRSMDKLIVNGRKPFMDEWKVRYAAAKAAMDQAKCVHEAAKEAYAKTAGPKLPSRRRVQNTDAACTVARKALVEARREKEDLYKQKPTLPSPKVIALAPRGSTLRLLRRFEIPAVEGAEFDVPGAADLHERGDTWPPAGEVVLVNVDYLMTALQQLPKGEITLTTRDAQSPIVLRARADGLHFQHVIMPMRPVGPQNEYLVRAFRTWFE